MLRNNFILGVLLGTLIGGTLAFLFMQDSLRKTRSHFFRLEENKEIYIADSLKRLDQTGLLRNMLDKLDDELRGNDRRSLSDETIDRIAAMCYVFKPYRYEGSDTTASKKLSPERGQLLLFLVSMHLDSGTYQHILSKADFSNADLRNADLRNAYLPGINLRNAYLKDVDLEGANLNGANLRTANLWGTNLRNTLLVGAELVRVDLQWADVSGADLRKANLTGANLSSAQLRETDLRYVVLEAADLNGAIVKHANFVGANLFRTSWKKATLSGVDLNGTNMTYADFTDANLDSLNLEGTELSGVTVSDKNWLMRLDERSIMGSQEIQSIYKLVEEPKTNPIQYRLEKFKK